MRDLPILFSAPMVRALVREAESPGKGKTQTRRLLPRLRRFGPITEFGRSDTAGYDWHFRDKCLRWHDLRHGKLLERLPYAIGDRLWVRETVCADDDEETWDHVVRYFADDATIKAADCNDVGSDAFGRWWLLKSYHSDDPDLTGGKPVPPIHMPRWASRLTLHVTDVRVERLQSISQADVIAEGITHRRGEAISECVAGWHEPYAKLWNSLHGADAWDANPWLVAITFQPVLANIDAAGDPLATGVAA